jgi:UDPglucose--hexose-1-phosphate uridylyltransferase
VYPIIFTRRQKLTQLRRDPVIGRWIIISDERSKRPHDYQSIFKVNNPEDIPEFKDNCPFCPGNEDMTPEEVLTYGENDTHPWSVRVVPNLYPALKPELELKKEGMGIYDIINGVGAHEVIIESPIHNSSFDRMELQEIEYFLFAVVDRMNELNKDERLEYIMVFKNHGVDAGATLEHPHCQLIATPIIPKRVSEELEGCKRHFDIKGRCIFCDIISQEKYDQRRIINETEHYIVLAPFASRFPYEVWILPKRHIASFPLTSPEEIKDLSNVFKDIFSRINGILNYPPFNFMLHTSPSKSEDIPYYHYHIELIPKLARVAGFEWGTGFYINHTPPERAATDLRDYQY